MPSVAETRHVCDKNEDELELLQESSFVPGSMNNHELKTAPVFTRDAFTVPGTKEVLPQRGVLGSVVESFGNGTKTSERPCDPRLYLNTNAPFSALVCGVQGSGKSHTVSVLLESMMVSNDPALGNLQQPLSGLVLHFGDGGAYSQPCEAAWLALSDRRDIVPPKVRVFISKSSLKTMKAVYAPLANAVTVESLEFSKSELDAQAFLSLMAVESSSASMPLYMQTVKGILRDLGENYSYDIFMRKLELKKQDMVPTQLAGLNQRMDLLNTFLDKKGRPTPSRFVAGQLTIVDLSDPFIDPASACAIFEILVRLFVRSAVGTGKVLVIDEAHKYLSPTPALSGLTKELASLVRQQRHQGMRVIISTQEPTVVPPVLLDLCPLMILHRFTSRLWWDHVVCHAAADVDDKEAFNKIVNLQTGQAVLLAPSGLDAREGRNGQKDTVVPFGRKCVVMKTRQRVTKDGGASILAVDS